MSNYAWLLMSVWAVDFVALVSPGPNFLLVSQTAMQRSSSVALAVALGIASGSVAWGTGVAIGLAAAFRIVPWLHSALRIGGATYLIYIGLRLWLSSGSKTADNATTPKRSLARAYLRGLVTNLLNPKSAVYYGSVFSLFFPPGTPGWVQGAAIASISVTSILWYSAIAMFFSTDPIRRVYISLQKAINRVAGIVMAGFGARLLLVRD